MSRFERKRSGVMPSCGGTELGTVDTRLSGASLHACPLPLNAGCSCLEVILTTRIRGDGLSCASCRSLMPYFVEDVEAKERCSPRGANQSREAQHGKKRERGWDALLKLKISLDRVRCDRIDFARLETQ